MSDILNYVRHILKYLRDNFSLLLEGVSFYACMVTYSSLYLIHLQFSSSQRSVLAGASHVA